MTEVSTGTADQDPLWRKRWMLLASMVVVLAAVALLVSMHQCTVELALVLLGRCGRLGGACSHRRAVPPRHAPAGDHRGSATAVTAATHRLTFCWIAAGLVCGSVSAAFDQAWIDIAVAAYVAVTLGAGLVLLRRRNFVN